ncbi:MAG: S8 family serine peptidase [Oscillospiraceae bacterium]|nr:S8 family serine peptidase [Oscillospiraceae bacterium]
MKRLISVLIILTICVMLFPHTINAEKDIPYEETSSYKEDEKIYCYATLKDDFADDAVIVVINRANSEINKEYTIEDFKEINPAGVRDLTYIKKEIDIKDIEYLDFENFRQILLIELRNKGKEEVLSAIKKLEKREIIQSAEPNYFGKLNAAPNDTYYKKEHQINENLGKQSDYLKRIGAEEAWDITKGSTSVKVGIIDTGIYYDHPDFEYNLHIGLDWNFVGDNDNANDIDGHGTHVAGIVGARGNNDVVTDDSLSVTGVNWKVSLVALKTADNISTMTEAVSHCAIYNIPIANISSGYPLSSWNPQSTINSLQAAITNYKGLVVCAAGNDDDNIDNFPVYPAAFQLNNLITVGSSQTIGYDTLAEDRKADHSNYSANKVDLFAPGTKIISTYTSNNCNSLVNQQTCPSAPVISDPDKKHFEYRYHAITGTSMATPMVTGTAALILSIDKSFTAAQIKRFILNTVDKNAHFNGKCVTGGRLNIYKAVKKAHETWQNSVDGTLLRVTDNNEYYIAAGGAPIPVVSWANVNVLQSYSLPITRSQLDDMRKYPKDGTFVRVAGSERYRFAGGAPIPITNWDHVGGWPTGTPVTWVDHLALETYSDTGRFSHVRKYPMDGTYVGVTSGLRYVFAGGAPILVTSWNNIDEPDPQFKIVDHVALETYSDTGSFSHVRQYPLNETYVGTVDGARFIFTGDAPIPVTSWANINEQHPRFTIVDPAVLHGPYSDTGPRSHVRQYPKNGTYVGTLSGARYVFAGGAIVPVTNWMNVDPSYPYFTIVDPAALNGTYSDMGAWSHIRPYPMDNTYVRTLTPNYYRFMGGIGSSVAANMSYMVVDFNGIVNINATISPSGSGTVTGSGIYVKNTQPNVNLVATPSSGYNFDGWYENGSKINNTGPIYIFPATANRTLQAKFTTSSSSIYTIVCNPSGGSVSPEIQYKTHDVPLTLPTPVRTNFTFKYWYSPVDNRAYYTGQVFELNSDATLNAYWVPSSVTNYTLSANLGGGTNSPSSILKPHGYAMRLPEPKRDNHTFKYWYSSADNKPYYPGLFFELNAVSSLTAYFVPSSTANYSLTLNLSGGALEDMSGGVIQKPHGYDMRLPVPKKTGFTFSYWKSSATGNNYYNGQMFQENAATTLTAYYV